MPSAEMRRFGREVPNVFFIALTLAHRARCAAAMRRRAEAGIVRRWDLSGPAPSSEVNAAIALTHRSRSRWSSLTTASRFAMRGIVALW